MPNSSHGLVLVPLLFLLIPAYSVTGQDNTRTSLQPAVTTDNPTRNESTRGTRNVTAQTQAIHSGAAADFELPEAVGAVALLLILLGASIGISRLVNYCYHRDVDRLDFESKHALGSQPAKKQKDDDNNKAAIAKISKRNATPFGDEDNGYQEMRVSCGNTTTVSINGNIKSDEDSITERTLDNATLPLKCDIWTVFNQIAPLDLAARPDGLPQTSGGSRPPLVQRYSDPIPKQQPANVFNHQPITDGLPKDQLQDGKGSKTAKQDDQSSAQKNVFTEDKTVDVLYQQPIAESLSSSSNEQYDVNVDTRTLQMKEQTSIHMYGSAGEDSDNALSNLPITDELYLLSKEQLTDNTRDSSVLEPKEQCSVQIDDSAGSDRTQHNISLQEETEYDVYDVSQRVNNYESDKSKESAATILKDKKKKRKKKRKDKDKQSQDDHDISIDNRDNAMAPVVESERATENMEDTSFTVTRPPSSQVPKTHKKKRKASKKLTSEVVLNTNVLNDTCTESKYTIEKNPSDFLPDVGQVNERKRKLLDLLTAERGALSPTRRHTFTQPSMESFNASYHVVDVHREKDGTVLGLQEKTIGSHMRHKTGNHDVQNGCHVNNGFEEHDDVFKGDKHSQTGRTDNERRVNQSIPDTSYSRLRALSMTSSMHRKNKANQHQNLTDREQHQTCWGSGSNDSQIEIYDQQEYIKRLGQLRRNRGSSSTKRAASCTDE
ncbi:uncharacterized protein [Branchiostoma lanceolatum]|uniref:uncharacterized protein isoform X2 n=1 Tax=Branchiostoma lanceolatum TaxID=7740 RepID=UPI003452BAD0